MARVDGGFPQGIVSAEIQSAKDALRRTLLAQLAKHGLDLTDQIYAEIQLDCPDHRLMVV